MATIAQTKMTVEEFLALPEEEGVYRELIRGELREYPRIPMTTRNAKHTLAVGRLSQIFWNWLDNQPELEGVVATGEARCRLSTDPGTVVGIDLALFLSNGAANVAEQGGIYEETPVVAVEVLSPTDTHQNISEKIHLYLGNNVPQVWIVDPELQTVTIFRPNDPPVMFNRQQTLYGEPELSNFHVDVSTIFTVKRPQK